MNRGTALELLNRQHEAQNESYAGGSGAALHHFFSARIGERGLNGCDFLHTDEHGLIDDLCVMVRPLSGTLGLAEAMKAELESAQPEPASES